MIDNQHILLAYYTLLPTCMVFLLRKQKSKKVLRLVFTVIMCLFVGLRGITIGSDTVMYAESFESGSFLNTISYETTWMLICSFVKYVVHGEFQLVLFIYAALSVLPVCYMCFHYSRYPFFSLLIYVLSGYYFLSFNILRQAAAIAFSMLGVGLFSRRKYIQMIIVFAGAFFVHRTAIIAPVLYLVVYWLGRMDRSQWKTLVLASLFFGLLLFASFNRLVGRLSIDKYALYADYASEKTVNYIALFLMNAISSFFCWHLISKDGEKSFFSKLFFASVILTNLIGYNIGINRIAYYLSFFAILAIPNILYEYKFRYPIVESEKNRKRGGTKRFTVAYLGVYSVLYFYSLLSNASGVYPF